MKVALVVGCSANVWDDVKRANALAEKVCIFDAIYCVKQIGIHWPTKFKVWATLHKVWATLHPEAMDEYVAERRALGHPDGYEIVAPSLGNGWEHEHKGHINRRVDYRYKGMNSSASSGIYAAKVAIEDGYRVVLAGIPMDKNAGHFLPLTRTIVQKNVRGPVWLEKETFDNGFEMCVPHMLGKVKSMSGHTRKIFGAPTPDWLRGDPLPVNSEQVPARCQA